MNSMTSEQLHDFKNRGLSLSFTEPSHSRFREKSEYIKYMMAEHPNAKPLELPFYTELNQTRSGTEAYTRSFRVGVYQLAESAAAGVTTYRIFAESYVHNEMCPLMDCVFEHDEPEYHEFLKLIDERSIAAAITLLANNSFKIYPTTKCNNWKEDKMPSM